MESYVTNLDFCSEIISPEFPFLTFGPLRWGRCKRDQIQIGGFNFQVTYLYSKVKKSAEDFSKTGLTKIPRKLNQMRFFQWPPRFSGKKRERGFLVSMGSRSHTKTHELKRCKNMKIFLGGKIFGRHGLHFFDRGNNKSFHWTEPTWGYPNPAKPYRFLQPRTLKRQGYMKPGSFPTS